MPQGLLSTATLDRLLAVPLGIGAPLRLVAHNRRRLEWLKWVDGLEVT